MKRIHCIQETHERCEDPKGRYKLRRSSVLCKDEDSDHVCPLELSDRRVTARTILEALGLGKSSVH